MHPILEQRALTYRDKNRSETYSLEALPPKGVATLTNVLRLLKRFTSATCYRSTCILYSVYIIYM